MHDKLKKGLAVIAATVALSAAAALPATAALDGAYPVKDTRGPGLRNWHCVDPHTSWRGPWRYTKSQTVIDCASYNTRADRP